MRTCLLTVSLLALGCSDSNNPILVPSNSRTEVHRFRSDEASFTQLSRISQSERLVIRNANDWAAAWALITPDAGQSPPTIDFSQQMVVLAALGTQPDAGYSIRVDSASIIDGELTIFVGTSTAAPSCGRALIITRPVDIAWLPRTDNDVRFVDVHGVTPCS